MGLYYADLPPGDKAGGPGLHSFFPPRDPNGEGLPPWPAFKQLEQYLEISPTPRVGQKLKEAQMQFWAEILSANFRQWQEKQKGRKAQEEL